MLVKDSDFDSLVPGLPLSRRTFVGASLAAGFALAVRPAQGQSVIQTAASGLSAGDITIKASDGVAVRAYWVQPSGKGPFPTVLVVSEIFGLHEYIRDTCRRLARQGYQAIAPDLFQRHGDPASVGSVAEILSTIVSKVPDAQVMGDLDACAGWAAANGGDPARLAITGFCWGGRVTWLYAATIRNCALLLPGMAGSRGWQPELRRSIRLILSTACRLRCSGFMAQRTKGSLCPMWRTCVTT